MDDFEKELAREKLHELLDKLLMDEELKRGMLARAWIDAEGNTHIRDYHLLLTVKDRVLNNE